MNVLKVDPKLGQAVKYELTLPKLLSKKIFILVSSDHLHWYPILTLTFLAVKWGKRGFSGILYSLMGKEPPQGSPFYCHEKNAKFLPYISYSQVGKILKNWTQMLYVTKQSKTVCAYST